MNNFDFTQFITFDSALPYEVIQDKIEDVFKRKGFLVTEFEEVEEVKNVPELVEEFVDDINEILMLDISNLRIIICSFAEKERTGNEFVCVSKNNLYEVLFKMAPFSFVCPDNLIVGIT